MGLELFVLFEGLDAELTILRLRKRVRGGAGMQFDEDATRIVKLIGAFACMYILFM